MSSPLTAKRRKINATSSTLTKPFVSPLRSRKTDPTPLQQNHNVANQLYQPSTLAHSVISTSPVSKSTASNAHSFNPAKSTSIHKQSAFTSSAKRTDPAELAAQKALTTLELQTRSVRNELDTLKQASQITSSTTDADLEDLAQKWKLLSQSCAEELFGTVKERVCRMGGVAAWRESEKKKHDRNNGVGDFQKEEEVNDDADCEFDSQGEELPEEEQEWRKREKARMKQERRDAMDDEGDGGQADEQDRSSKVWQEPGNDDDTFTMDMMLRSLNVELKVIGYDKLAQMWVA